MTPPSESIQPLSSREAMERVTDSIAPRFWVAGPVAELRVAAATGLAGALVTNPTVLAQWNESDSRPVEMIAAELAESTGLPVYIQLRGPDYADLLRQADLLQAAHPRLIPKLPASEAGFAACRQLGARQPVLITGIASLAQVFAAHTAGARFICPYLARLRTAGTNIAPFFEQMVRLGARFPRPMELVPASVRTIEDVELALQHGATGVIVFTALFHEMLRTIATEQALEGFERDWAKIKTRLK